MGKQHIMQYFLGGNTADGFFSIYDNFVSPKDGDFLWIIKGGPGCGKSSFMRMIGAAAERAGLDVEYVLCSGDPESLDGVYIPELKIGYMDGTAPHVTDARIAAVDSAYLDLGAFYDREAIAEYKTELEKLFAENKNQYTKAYSLLSAAGSLRRGWLNSLSGYEAKNKAQARIESLAAREFGKKARNMGSVKRRFISSNTYKGEMHLTETEQCLCQRLYSLENRYLLGSHCIERLADRAMSSGYDIYLCPDPLTPEFYEAMFVPGLSLGFVCKNRNDITSTEISRNIRLDNMVSSESRRELKACERLTDSLKSSAYEALSEAKKYHDLIEVIYNPHVDFDGVYALVEKHIAGLGLK